ncbi:MAG: glycerol-3-phosphate responsive antiterminator [Clostridiaceae bacterium]
MIEDLLADNPIIAAVRDEDDLENAVKSKAKIVFVLFGDIINIPDISKKLMDNSKKVFIHLDMIGGLKADQAGVKFIKKYVNPSGIITTKTANIKYGNQQGLITIQRMFIVDSLSFKTGIKSLKDVSPNAIEVMPGVSADIIKRIREKVNLPIIAGGLVSQKSDIYSALDAGAVAISTTCRKLWNM